MQHPTIWPHFFTATIQNWLPLLKENSYKDIIVDTLHFLASDKRIELNAFVINEQSHTFNMAIQKGCESKCSIVFQPHAVSNMLRLLLCRQ